MALKKNGTFAALFLAFIFVACGDDSGKTSGGSVEDQEVVAISDKTVSGVSQKGPFVNGSSVTVQELDGETLAQTGNSYEGKIKNDMGEFSVKVAKLASQYALLKANGFYRNEVSGEKSKSQVTLYALTDLSDRDEVNVNLLTHLEYERSLYLVSVDSMSVADAKKQAEKEVLASFGITGDFANSEDLDIFGTSDENAALLAISILMQGNLNEADFSERLANYAADIETDGKWDDAKTATKIADWASSKSLGGELENIRNNIAKWDISTNVPAFEKYVDNFWWQNYGLGTCDKKRNDEILQNTNKQSETYGTYFICDNNAWRLATVLEYDTYKWIDPTRRDTTKDAAVRYGDVIKTNCYVFENKKWRSGNETDCSLNLRGCTALRQDTVGKGKDKVWHICDAKNWRDATTYEKDTFGWKDSSDGAIKKGNVTDTVYVFDKTAWRATNDVEAKLGGCVSAIADSVGKVGSTYYICKSNKWVEASALEYDTYRWVAGKDGDSKTGSMDAKNCYVYEENVWRSGESTDCSLGLRGCTALRQDTVGKGSDDEWYMCDEQKWRTATNIEKDTATWGSGKFDGEVRAGQINKIFYYIYDASIKAWREATTLEKDTYDYKNNKDWTDGMEGEIKKGEVTDTIYVFDSTVWRIATEIEYDTYGQECSKFGKIIYGNVNKDYAYFCYDDKWKRFYGNEKILYGKLVDERDGHIYRTVKIGEQTWMAENLNYDSGQWSFCDEEDSCAIYGRYYMYDVNHRSEAYVGICPSGWHVPSSEEWISFSSAVGKKSKALQAQGFIGWTDADDEFGFSALPVGNLFMNMGKAEIFNFGGDYAYFVGSTGDNACAWLNNFIIGKNESELTCGVSALSGYSVRCIQD